MCCELLKKLDVNQGLRPESLSFFPAACHLSLKVIVPYYFPRGSGSLVKGTELLQKLAMLSEASPRLLPK